MLQLYIYIYICIYIYINIYIYIYGKVSKLGCVTRVITTTHQTIPSEQVTFGGNKLFGNTTAVRCTFLADIVANTIEQKHVDTVIMSKRTCKRPPYSEVGPTARYCEQEGRLT